MSSFSGGEVTLTIDGETYRFDPTCFFQANLGLLPAFVVEALAQVDAALAAAEDAPLEPAIPRRTTAIDLFCGVGLFTLPLARRFERVYGVEVHGHAAGFARRNIEAAGVGHTRIAEMPVSHWLATRGASVREPDLVLVDPPRSGLDPATIQGLIRLRPRRFTYVSCDPATLARDLKPLLGFGFNLIRIVALDMFPQTHHVEVIAHLERGG
jgi:23S rRNA (uracil1939-C5)-methyltransferase